MSNPFKNSKNGMHSVQPGIGVLLVNLGTPDEPTAGAVRRYLAEFLSDKRVVELPGWLWKPVLHGIVLRTRPAQSAAKYASIWMEQGSPLLVHVAAQTAAVQQQLQAQEPERFVVRYAMRYGNPAIGNALNDFVREGISRILVLPLYPQYSGTSTASVLDAVYGWGLQQRHIPEMRFVNDYHDDAGYIQALKHQIETHWQQHGRSQHLLMSFHGVPQKVIDAGDPYQQQCLATAAQLTAALGLTPEQYNVSFQSRFGKAQWIEPATEPTLCKLARQGVQSVDVACPGFTADCLETLEEINMECRQAFLDNGGVSFQYIPCLNAQPTWVNALVDLVRSHTQGWGQCETQTQSSPS
jgi:ferrochelatase